jgi:hypothetical protein
VAVTSEAGHRRAVTSHVAVEGELTTHWATQGGVVREEACVVYSLNKLLFMCELDIGL